MIIYKMRTFAVIRTFFATLLCLILSAQSTKAELVTGRTYEDSYGNGYEITGADPRYSSTYYGKLSRFSRSATSIVVTNSVTIVEQSSGLSSETRSYNLVVTGFSQSAVAHTQDEKLRT